MKKILRMLFIPMFLLVIVVRTFPQALAAVDTYELSELELEITIPSEYTVITRDISASDPIFSELGITKSDLISQFETSSIYLNALSHTYNEEIVVTMTENGLSNFNSLSDTTLNILISTLSKQFADYGINVSKYEIYQHSQTKFVRLYFTDTANTVHGVQYYTIYNGKAMNFTMRSYTGSLSSRQEATIEAVVDSIEYNNILSSTDSIEETNSFIYTDTDSGVTFTFPENWKQEEFFKDREFIDAKFVSTKEEDCIIIFGSTDMWGQMSVSERAGYIREDLNNSFLTKSDIAEMYNTTTDKISIVTYNDIQYYKGEITQSFDVYGLDISLTMTQLIYIDNGWMYTFQFGGTSEHELYSDFESLLNSVQYPVLSDISDAGVIKQTSSESNSPDDHSNQATVVILLSIVVIVLMVILIFLKKNSGKDIQASYPYPPHYNTANPVPPNNSESTILCKNCGQPLPPDSAFCYMCGSKIDK